MTHRYNSDSRWMHDHWTSLADDDELIISAGGLRQWMAECLARSLGQPIAVEQHDEDRSQTIARVYQQHKRLQHDDVYADDEHSEEPSYELEDHQDEAGPTLHEGNQPEPVAHVDQEPSFLNRFLKALHGQPDATYADLEALASSGMGTNEDYGHGGDK